MRVELDLNLQFVVSHGPAFRNTLSCAASVGSLQAACSSKLKLPLRRSDQTRCLMLMITWEKASTSLLP
jgi:hypothetical protein